MKKLAVTMVTIAMLAVGCISASAVESPEVPGNVAGDSDVNNNTNNSTSNSNNNDANNVNAGKTTTSTTSAKTGVSGSYAIFAALGVIACGGVATVAKRKVSE
ncbi:MAG: hypothetical protein UIM53_00135 [Acutalibacteraceae bacterium]|nr:hypothetical protein [Acutalibacteraceae bacterium]